MTTLQEVRARFARDPGLPFADSLTELGFRHTDAALCWSMGPGRASRHGSRWAIRSAPVPPSRTLPCPTLQERMRAEAETVDPRESMATTP